MWLNLIAKKTRKYRLALYPRRKLNGLFSEFWNVFIENLHIHCLDTESKILLFLKIFLLHIPEVCTMTRIVSNGSLFNVLPLLKFLRVRIWMLLLKLSLLQPLNWSVFMWAYNPKVSVVLYWRSSWRWCWWLWWRRGRCGIGNLY